MSEKVVCAVCSHKQHIPGETAHTWGNMGYMLFVVHVHPAMTLSFLSISHANYNPISRLRKSPSCLSPSLDFLEGEEGGGRGGRIM